MKHTNKIVMATVLAGSMSLAGLGISRAQAADASATVGTAVDTAINTTTATTTAPAAVTSGRGQHRAERLADQAEKFGMTTTELQTALDSGTPMYQIAAEHGVTYAKEKATRLAEMKNRLDDMVKVKYMTQAEADAAYAEAQSSTMIGGPGFGGPHGHR